MRVVTSYMCEGCGQTFTYVDEALECEAKHLDLTLSEYKHYLELKEKVKQACWRRGYSQNEYTLRAEDEAINELINFERTYNIKGDY